MEGDPYLLYRIVGFYEYSQALDHLTRLIKSLTKEELAAAEAIVSSSPEYLVYSLYEDLSALGEKQQGDSPYRSESGLARLMALARVEVAAMLAGFSHHPSPFEGVQPTAFEFEPFREFVIEGARAHYEALSRDEHIRQAAEQYPPNETTLAYIRELNIARQFQAAAGQLHSLWEQNVARSPAQEPIARLYGGASSWVNRKQTLDAIFMLYATQVQSFLNTTVVSESKDTVKQQLLIQSCIDGVCVRRDEIPGIQVNQLKK